MKKFKYNLNSGRFATFEEFAKKRFKGSWIDVELSDKQSEDVLLMIKSDRNYERKFRDREEASLEFLEDEVGWEPSGDADVENDCDKKIFQSVFVYLNERQQQLVSYRYYEQKTDLEISKILEVSRPAITQQFGTIHKILEKYLKKFCD
ncbi:MAG: hypothetical protein FWE22_03940 [Firmicutes bacterium]|nr:hypothetical protein [Bacillota bacterium]